MKVVETCPWAQTKRNMDVYIDTSNILKLYLLNCPRKSGKTVSAYENTNFASEGRRDFSLGLNEAEHACLYWHF